MAASTDRFKFDIDRTIKFGYRILNNNSRFHANQVGPCGYITLTNTHPCMVSADLISSGVLTAAQIIYCDPTYGDDSTGDGTKTNPYLTPLKSANMTTATVPYVSIIGSHDLDLSGFRAGLTSVYFLGMLKDNAKTTVRYITYTLGYTPTDTETVCVDSDNGLDTNAGTAAAPVATYTHALSLCVGAINKIKFLNSGTYEENGFTLSGQCVGMYADIGCTPIIKPKRTDANTTATISVAGTALTSESVQSKSTAILKNGHVVHAWRNSTGAIYYSITSMDGSDEFTAVTEIDDGSTTTTMPCVARIDDDKFIITWTTGSGTLAHPYKCVYKIYTELTYDPWTVSNTGLKTLRKAKMNSCGAFPNQSGDILIVYEKSDNSIFYQVIDSTGAQVAPETSTGFKYSFSVGVMSDGSWVLAGYTGASSPYSVSFIIIDSLGAISVNSMLVSAACTSVLDTAIAVYDDDYFAVIWESSHIHWSVYDSSGALQSSTTSAAYNTTLGLNSVVVINGDLALIIYYKASATYTISAIGLGSDGKEYTPEITIATSESNVGHAPSIGRSDNDEYYIIYNDSNGYHNSATATISIYWDAIKITSAAEMRGITIDADDQKYLYRTVHATAAFTRMWCDIKGASYENDHGGIFGLAAHCAGAFVSKNNLIHNNGGGDYVESDSSDIEDNAYYRQASGWSACITGNGSGVIVKHNTMVFSPGALRLIGNDGNEVVSHNIMYGNDVCDISADVEIAVSYSDMSGESINIDLDEDTTINKSPLFLNSGAESDDDTDLTLQSSDILDFSNSPCGRVQFGVETGGTSVDDDRDLGCYDTIISDIDDSCKYATLSKPRKGISVEYGFTGSSNKELMFGFSSRYDGKYEKINIEWDGIEEDEYDDLLEVLSYAGDYGSLIRIWGNPTTEPNTYIEANVLYSSVAGNASTFKLSGSGAQKVKASFGRGMAEIS